MNNHYHKNRSIMIMGILITLIWLALSVFVNRIYDKRMEEYLDHQDEMFTNGIESIINTYSSYAEFIYQSILNTPEIRAIMSEAQSADQESKALLREELYQELIETYDLLTEHDFRHLQFHLANGESFLRLHKPERYGDSLISVRESIRYVTTEHQFISGFEEGRVSNGYRYVFPLFNGEDFIGSVELSLSPATIIQELYNMTENQGYGYLLNKSIMENVDFCDEQNQYRLSLTSDLYVVDLEVYQIMVNQPGVPDLFFEDDFVSAVRMGVEKDLAKGQSFMYTLNYQDQYYLIEYDQIKDISGQAIGYFFSVSEDEQIANLIQARDLSLLLIAIVYFMLLLMIHYVNRRDKEIMQVAMYDQLTEIYNRRSFFELAHVEVEKNNRSNQPLAVAIFDIDHFKMVNDRFGHHVGDQVLRELAQIIKASIRSYDIFARLGGEEFILLMPETNQKVALLVMERIRLMVLNHSFQTAEKITISIGLTEKKQNESLDATIVRADTAMYTAKGNGRNRTELL